MTPWRQYLEYAGICNFEEGNCPCDKGHNCNKCLEDDVYKNFLIFKKKRGMK